MRKHWILPLLLLVSSCLINETPKATSSSLLVEKGDVVALSYNTDSLVIFSPSGELKGVLYQLPNASDSIGAMAWLQETNEILLTVNGSPDRIEAVSVLTGTSRTFFLNTSAYNGTPLGITQLTDSGDIIASEGTTIERFSSNGIRQSIPSVWPSSVLTNSVQITTLSDGNWLSCSSSAGIKIFPDSTTTFSALYSATRPVASTNAYGCGELSDGQIVVSWAGSTDHIYKYDATLGSASPIISNNTSVFTDPRGIAIGEDDQIYVAATARNRIVQLDQDGNVVQEFGGAVLNSPRHVIVIPGII